MTEAKKCEYCVDGVERCGDFLDFICTREKGHSGDHVACGTVEHGLARWPQHQAWAPEPYKARQEYESGQVHESIDTVWRRWIGLVDREKVAAICCDILLALGLPRDNERMALTAGALREIRRLVTRQRDMVSLTPQQGRLVCEALIETMSVGGRVPVSEARELFADVDSQIRAIEAAAAAVDDLTADQYGE